jgi:hypothetical protein
LRLDIVISGVAGGCAHYRLVAVDA